MERTVIIRSASEKTRMASDCPDALVSYSARFDECGLIVHDGGGSVISIAFCPWCGTRLPPSQRDAWFDALERRGIDPGEDDVPPEFQTAAWRTASPAD
ncbi:DUF6980 family protein [Actinomadura verrucosospora]|uniref:DUF6980 family protein n=1 Tax=Actinomadura verrucosospora TaxID=46165 RepID=UPI001C20390C|nr:hypothetical protein [Actinomadura verrucosospora]